jgi:probable F420-dependent oxidoreductase
MKVYAGMDPRLPLSEVAAHAQRIESLGYDGLHVAETIHDSLAVSMLALEHTTTLTVRTAVTIAFARSPTVVATSAWGLSKMSGGRFELGLGTQVRQNIEQRFAMPWSDPVDRLGDYIAALTALFESFATGEPPAHHGPYYAVTRLQPYFNPGPDPEVAAPPIWIGGVNEQICQLAGTIAEGFITHPTSSTPRYLSEICRPNLAIGAAANGRALSDLELVAGTQVITGSTEEEMATEAVRQRSLLGFLFSTPAYRRTLELSGWGALGDELRTLIAADRWEDLGEVITDEILGTVVPMATLDELPTVLLERFGDVADGILLNATVNQDDVALAAAICRLQRAP